MKLTNEQIKEFRKIYLDVYGDDLPWNVATEIANQTINFLLAIYEPRNMSERDFN